MVMRGMAAGTQLNDPYRATRYGGAGVAYQYTGQRNEASLGIYYYGARWYDPGIGKFMQADTIVPEPGNPQSLNRYSYVLNNPMKYTDPTGMIEENEQEEADSIRKYLLETYGVDIELDYFYKLGFWVKGNWKLDSLKMFRKGIEELAYSLGGSASFRKLTGYIFVSKNHTLTPEEQLADEPNHSHGGFANGLGYIKFCATCDVTIRLTKHETDHVIYGKQPDIFKDFIAWYYPGPDKPPYSVNSEEFLADKIAEYSDLYNEPLTVSGSQFLLGGLTHPGWYEWIERHVKR